MSNSCDVKIGDVVWRLLDPHDGGGVSPQIGWVEEIHGGLFNHKVLYRKC